MTRGSLRLDSIFGINVVLLSALSVAFTSTLRTKTCRGDPAKHPTDGDLSVGTPQRKKPLECEASVHSNSENAIARKGSRRRGLVPRPHEFVIFQVPKTGPGEPLQSGAKLPDHAVTVLLLSAATPQWLGRSPTGPARCGWPGNRLFGRACAPLLHWGQCRRSKSCRR